MIPLTVATADPQIVLTELRESDLERLSVLINDPVVYKNTLSIPHPYKLTDAVKYYDQVRKFESLNGYQKDWIIRKKGELIGGIGLLYNHGFDTHKSEFGYWLGSDFHGQGIMTLCVSSFIEMVFATTKMVRIEAHVFSHNGASCRVLEKCGFEKEGYLRKPFIKDGKYLDAHLYSLVR